MNSFRSLLITFSFLLTTSNAYSVGLEDLEISGFLSQGFTKSDPNSFIHDHSDGTFEFNEVGINFRISMSDKIDAGLQFLMYDFGELGNNKPSLDWANVSYHHRDWLGFRAGKLKMPLGLYNETRDIDFLRTFIFLPSSIYIENWRDAYSGMNGIGLYGSLPNGFSYQLQTGGMNIAPDSGYGDTWTGQGLAVEEYDVENISTAALRWRSQFGLTLMGSMVYNKMNVWSYFFEEKISGPYLFSEGFIYQRKDYIITNKVLSAEYTISDFTFAAEFMRTEHKYWTRYKSTFIPTGVTSTSDWSSSDREQESYYISASYAVLDWLELGTYYSVLYYNRKDKKGDFFANVNYPRHQAWHKNLALASKIEIAENLYLKFEYQYIDGTLKAYANYNENSDRTERYSNVYSAKISYNF